MSAEDWERQAEHWIAWARTPGHDSYLLYRDAFFELVPEPGRATLEIGCGELERDPSERRWQRLPCFLMLRAIVASCESG